MKHIKTYEDLPFSDYFKFSENDIVVLLQSIFPFEKNDILKVLKVDKNDKKLSYKIGNLNDVDNNNLTSITWAQERHLRLAEPYEIQQIKYNL